MASGIRLEHDALGDVEVPADRLWGAQTQRSLRLIYSVEGPPFLELIEAQEDGVWGRQHGEGLHHIGVWQDGLDARIAELAAAGVEPQAIIHHLGETLAVYLTPETAHGARLELVRRKPSD